jgi:hypothetical protein
MKKAGYTMLELGWLYSSSGQNGSVWLWSGEHGWLWTKADIWPYLYKDEAADWLYFVKSEDGLPVFYDYSTSSYLGHEREDIHSTRIIYLICEITPRSTSSFSPFIFA